MRRGGLPRCGLLGQAVPMLLPLSYHKAAPMGTRLRVKRRGKEGRMALRGEGFGAIAEGLAARGEGVFLGPAEGGRARLPFFPKGREALPRGDALWYNSGGKKAFGLVPVWAGLGAAEKA